MTDHETLGQKFKRVHPDWPHECCYAGWCVHRSRKHEDAGEGLVRCESPAACDYYCKQATGNVEVRGGKGQ